MFSPDRDEEDEDSYWVFLILVGSFFLPAFESALFFGG